MRDERAKYLVDAAAALVAGGSMLDYLPHIAAGMSIIWTSLRIYETKTVQRWLGRK